MRFLIVLCVFLFSTVVASAQEMGEKVRNGKTYKVYAVMQGNTLYSLHVKYGVSVADIKAANPKLKDDLDVGQIIYIPVVKSDKTENKYTIHVVKRHETLFGISRKYNCSVDAIIHLNPGVEKGLDVGQELKVPTEKDNETTVQQTSNNENNTKSEQEQQATENTPPHQNDSIIQYEVHKGETLYSISKRFMVGVNKLMEVNNLASPSIKKGQLLTIPLKKEDTSNIAVRKVPSLDTTMRLTSQLIPQKEAYKILVLLPLNLSGSSKIISGMYDENTKLNRLTDASVQFLMGAQMAIDSLQKLGLNGEVKFFDTERNLEQLKKVLKDSNTSKWDVVIGPFFPKMMQYTATWGKANKVPIIAVTTIPTAYLKGNPYLLSMVPSHYTLIGGMAKYLAKNYSHANIVMIQGKTAKEKEWNAYFKQVFNDNLADSTMTHIKMSSIGKSSGGGLAYRLNTEKKNFMICLSDNVQQVMQFVNTLNAAKNLSRKYSKADVVMVGLKEWNNMTPLNDYYKNKFDFHFAASNYVNYDTTKVLDFTRSYRKRYGSDPSKYAMHGFDVVLSQLSSLIIGVDRNEGMIDHFNIHKLGLQLGRVNGSVFIIEQKDFTLHLLKVVDSEVHFDTE